MRTHSGVAAKMFQTLADHGINIIMISTSEIKVSCVIDLKFTELAVRVLHRPSVWGSGRTLMRKIEIYDTTLRDGAQSEDIAFSVEDKLRITESSMN